MKTVQYQHGLERLDQGSRIESLEIGLTLYGNFIYDKPMI